MGEPWKSPVDYRGISHISLYGVGTRLKHSALYFHAPALKASSLRDTLSISPGQALSHPAEGGIPHTGLPDGQGNQQSQVGLSEPCLRLK